MQPDALAAGDYSYRVVFFDRSGGTPTAYESATQRVIRRYHDRGRREHSAHWPSDRCRSGNWDGRRLYRSVDGGDFELVATLDATTANYTDNGSLPRSARRSTTTSLDQGNYSYYVTFYNTSTQHRKPADAAHRRHCPSPTSIAGFASTTSRNRRPADFNAVRIYRNIAGNTSEFHLVATLTDGQTTYIDNVPDADIVSAAGNRLDGPEGQPGHAARRRRASQTATVYSTPFEPGVLTFTGKKGDRTLAPKSSTITATTTVQDLIEFMDQAFGIDDTADTPYSISPGGEITPTACIRFTSNMGIENRLTVGLSAFTLTPTGSDSTHIDRHRLRRNRGQHQRRGLDDRFHRLRLARHSGERPNHHRDGRKDSDSRTYRWYATSEDNEPLTGVDTVLGNGTITFDGNGRIISGADGHDRRRRD